MRPFHFLLLLITLTLWGGYYVAGKYALELFPPFFLTALRFIVVAAVLLPWCGLPNISMKRVALLSVLLGVFNFGFGLAGMGWGINVATAIVVGQLGVPFSCMFGSILLKDKLGPWRSSGLVIAMMGAVFIAGTPNVANNYAGFIALLSASVGWGLANILMKQYGEVKIWPFLGWMALMAAGQLLVLSAIFETGQIAAMQKIQWREVVGVLYLALGATIGAYAIWYYLLFRYLASQITPYTMLGPFIAFGLGKLFLDSPITPQVMISAAITLIGVGIIVMRRPRLAMLGKVRARKLSQTVRDDLPSIDPNA
ncbi:MAG: EamA family transporter [Alphaproteobacteria bacterium]|nr:EamA family transporter [Alphaproteobacteria bacterium]